MMVFALLLSCAVTASAWAQTVSTLVAASPVGDGIVVAEWGEIFVASGFGRPTVMKVTAKGEVSELATGLERAVGIAIGPDGSFYVNNYGNGDISRITPAGEVSVWVQGLNGPAGIVFDADGVAFVSEFGANFSGTGRSVRRISPDGEKQPYLSGNGLQDPIGIALDDKGDLYVSNWSGGIYRSRAGAAPELFANIEGANINQIAYADGYLYVPSPNLRKIFRISQEGAVEHFAGSGLQERADGPALSAGFTRPNGIASSPDGRTLYVVDVVDGNTGAIRKINLDPPSTAVEDSSWGELKAK